MKVLITAWYLAICTSFVYAQWNVSLVGSLNAPGAYNVVVDGNFAYVAAFDNGLRVINISNPSSPFEVGHFNTSGSSKGVAVSGHFAYVADYTAGLRVIDITTPNSPYEIGFLDTPGGATDVTVEGNYAYVADINTLRVINITNPAVPTLAGAYSTPGSAWGVAVLGNYAYVADYNLGLRVVNITIPSNPVSVGFFDTQGLAIDVAIAGNFAYIADAGGGLRIINVSNPMLPFEVGYFDSPGSSRGVAVKGSYAYLADEDGGLRVINILNPNIPFEVGFYQTNYAIGVAVSGNYAYVAESAVLLNIFDVSYFESQEPICQSTLIPFVDDFNSPTLDSCWQWVRENSSQWSLITRDGWLRIIPEGVLYGPGGNVHNILLRSVDDTDFTIMTYIEDFGSTHEVGLIVYQGDDQAITIGYQHEAPGQIRASFEGGPEPWYGTLFEEWMPVFLRIDKIGNHYSAFASPDSINWHFVYACDAALATNDGIQVGLYGIGNPPAPDSYADFDFFSITSDNILPVELLSFTATPSDKRVTLNWSTGSESNVSHFEIDRDGVALARVEATNQPSGHAYTWLDNDVTNDQSYRYSLTSVDFDGSRIVHGTVEATPHEAALPTELTLSQNYPNPFNASTTIEYSLPEATNISLKLFNLAGQEVAVLASGAHAAGRHVVNLNANDLSSGIYFYRLESPVHSVQQKMVLLK